MTPARKALEAEIAKLGLPRNKTVEQERIEELEAELAALRKRLEQARRVDIDLETQYIDAQLKLVELNKELANYRTDTKMLLDLGERHIQIENELTQKLIAQRAEIASLRKTIEDRRTVDGWANAHGGTITLDCFANGDVELDIRNGDTGKREFNSSARSIDEAYSAAAEWVRNNS